MLLTVFAARHLTALYLATAGNTPYCIDMAIRFGFRIFANDDMPDDARNRAADLLCVRIGDRGLHRRYSGRACLAAHLLSAFALTLSSERR